MAIPVPMPFSGPAAKRASNAQLAPSNLGLVLSMTITRDEASVMIRRGRARSSVNFRSRVESAGRLESTR